MVITYKSKQIKNQYREKDPQKRNHLLVCKNTNDGLYRLFVSIYQENPLDRLENNGLCNPNNLEVETIYSGLEFNSAFRMYDRFTHRPSESDLSDLEHELLKPKRFSFFKK